MLGHLSSLSSLQASASWAFTQARWTAQLAAAALVSEWVIPATTVASVAPSTQPDRISGTALSDSWNAMSWPGERTRESSVSVKTRTSAGSAEEPDNSRL